MVTNTWTQTSTVILTNAVLESFTAAIQSLTSFASDFSAAAAQRGSAVRVLYIPSQGAGAIDFAGSYAAGNTSANGVDVIINKHKFISWGLNDVEYAVNNLIRIEQFGKQFGYLLAKSVLQDIWSVITNANYGAAIFTGAASTFDVNDLITIKTAIDNLYWPEFDRLGVFTPAYYNGILGVEGARLAYAIGSTLPAQQGKLTEIVGFNLNQSALVPANGENLVGFVARPDAMAVACRYLEPQPGNTYLSAFSLTNVAGFTLGFRDYYNNDSGQRTQAIEANYGYTIVNNSALKRLTSA
jgi:hypothetical protein